MPRRSIYGSASEQGVRCVCPILERPVLVEETGFGRDAWSLVRCRETGFVFLANPPDYGQMESELAWERTSATERKRREAQEPMLLRISSWTSTAKRFVFPRRDKVASLAVSVAHGRHGTGPLHIVDIGCGSGRLLVEIHNRFARIGQEVVSCGIEVSSQLALRAQERVAPLGGKVVSTNALNGLSHVGRDSIHVAIMSSFLEHERRPLSLLRRLRPLLAADGAIVLKVPNFASWNRVVRGRKWCGFRFPDHVNYFTPRTLRRLAEEAAFAVSRQTILDHLPFSDNMYAVLTPRPERDEGV